MSSMKQFIQPLLAVVLLSMAVVGCNKEDDPAPPIQPPTNESELITTLVLTFNDPETSETFTMRFSDPDGDGGNAPVITADALPTGRAYVLSLTVLDESGSSPVNLTNQIQAEADEHQFFFAVQGANLTVSYSDQDANGKPLGLVNLAISGASSTGSLTVGLRHQPDKNAAGVSDGDITNAGGDTDIEVVFPVTIQ
jgi:hypothetical protein